MSGHSKWSTIKRKKEKTDADRAKIFTKMAREMTVCVKDGGGDPAVNGKLRELIAKARSLNVPADNINRVIKKAEGAERDSYDAVMYEGYGPSGVAVIVEALTDNRNRTASNLRHYFDKFGGNLGTTGCVQFLFKRIGVIVVNVEGMAQSALEEHILESGAQDYSIEAGELEVITDPTELLTVRAYFERAGMSVLSAELEYDPLTTAKLADEEALKNLNLLLEHLEEDDDVQSVWHTFEAE